MNIFVWEKQRKLHLMLGSAKKARLIGRENLTKPDNTSYIDKCLAELQSKAVADQQEVMEYLTAVMGGQVEYEELMVIPLGDFESELQRMSDYRILLSVLKHLNCSVSATSYGQTSRKWSTPIPCNLWMISMSNVVKLSAHMPKPFHSVWKRRWILIPST